MTPRLAALALAVALGACADPAAVRSRGTDTRDGGISYAPDTAVLQVGYLPHGLRPPGSLPDLPFWTLYGDGRLLTPGARPAIYPGAALPPVQVARVAADAVERIAREARAAGVNGTKRDYGDVGVMDASTTFFRLAGEHSSAAAEVYALETGNGNEHRRRLQRLLTNLTDLDRWLGAGTVGAEQAYEPAAVAVYARPYRPHDHRAYDLPPEQALAWTGPDPAAGTATEAGRCTVLTGAALAGTLPGLRRSHELTRWTYAGQSWGFQLRPLLPHESSCADGLGYSQ